MDNILFCDEPLINSILDDFVLFCQSEEIETDIYFQQYDRGNIFVEDVASLLMQMMEFGLNRTFVAGKRKDAFLRIHAAAIANQLVLTMDVRVGEPEGEKSSHVFWGLCKELLQKVRFQYLVRQYEGVTRIERKDGQVKIIVSLDRKKCRRERRKGCTSEKMISMDRTPLHVQEEMSEMRKYQHDVKRHLRILEEILSRYEEKNRECPHRSYCKNEIVDILCSIKKEECRQKEIPLTFFFDFSGQIPMGETELSALLQNMLDNAIEANEKIENPRQRFLYLAIVQEEADWCFMVENSCPEPDEVDFKSRKSDHGKHGYGMKIIEEITKKYQGEMQYMKDEEEKRIRISVFLPQKDGGAKGEIPGGDRTP